MNCKMKYLFLTIISLLLIGIGILLLEMRNRQIETTVRVNYINDYCLE